MKFCNLVFYGSVKDQTLTSLAVLLNFAVFPAGYAKWKIDDSYLISKENCCRVMNIFFIMQTNYTTFILSHIQDNPVHTDEVLRKKAENFFNKKE